MFSGNTVKRTNSQGATQHQTEEDRRRKQEERENTSSTVLMRGAPSKLEQETERTHYQQLS